MELTEAEGCGCEGRGRRECPGGASTGWRRGLTVHGRLQGVISTQQVAEAENGGAEDRDRRVEGRGVRERTGDVSGFGNNAPKGRKTSDVSGYGNSAPRSMKCEKYRDG